MTSYLVCLPYAYQPYFDICESTMKFPAKNVLAIDNTVDNIGIMAAHNLGAQRVLDEQLDWLIILSAAVRFGEPGGLDFIDVLDAHPDHYIIHAASENVKGGKQQEGGGGHNKVFGWHLTAFKREVFENIGLWDENFTPYGLDDIDLSLRIQKFYQGRKGWDTFPIDVADTTMSHSINLAHVKSLYHPRNSYLMRKWGRDGGDWENEGYEHPFNDPSKSLSWWPEPEHELSIYNNEFGPNGQWKYEAAE